MKRALALTTLVVVAAVLVDLLAHRRAGATVDDDVFTSRDADVRMLAPRGWRVSEAPSYPGVLLWMTHTKPPGKMLLTVEDIGAASRACWPKECGRDPTVPSFVCVLSSRLKSAGFQLGPVEDGRWFDYQQGKGAKRFLRQGVVVLGHHAFTLILSTETTADRATHARAFDRALRSLRPLSASGEDGVASADGSGAGRTDVVVDPGALAAAGTGAIDAGAAPADASRAPTATIRDAGPRPSDATMPITSVPPGPAIVDAGASDTEATTIDAAPPRADAGVPVVEEVPPCRATP